MKALARFTGALFIIVGLLIVIVGVVFLGRGLLRPEPFVPSLFGAAQLESLLLPLRLMTGGLMSIQGLMLAAVGEGLWLLASIAEHTEEMR